MCDLSTKQNQPNYLSNQSFCQRLYPDYNANANRWSNLLRQSVIKIGNKIWTDDTTDFELPQHANMSDNKHRH